MRFLFLLILLGLFLINPLISSNLAIAHSENQSSFFSINGDYSIKYPVPTTSLPNFDLPEDLDDEVRLVNQPLEMEIDTSKLAEPLEIINKSTISWNFGDGTMATGLRNTHTYSKIGSYIVKITIKYPSDSKNELLQSVMVNILPNKDYRLPKAIIEVNGKQSQNPLTDLIKVDFKQPINFSAKSSESGSEIVSYVWDFGDGQSSNKVEDSHRYNATVYQYFPLLRIKNADGFISDAFVEVQGDELTAVTPTSSQNNLTNKYPFIIGGTALLALLTWKILKKRK